MKRIELNNGMAALVDDEDYDMLMRFEWFAQKQGKPGQHEFWYAERFYSESLSDEFGVGMHRMILGVTDPKIFVDHQNHDGLDNRRANLRECDNSKNQMNRRKQAKPTTSIYKGVDWRKQSGKWRAQIKISGKQKHIGMYVCEVEAAKAYDKVALELFGIYAHPNF